MLNPEIINRSGSQYVEAVLRERIKDEVYPPGSWLPAERMLAGELGVHRRAVRAAISSLVSDGLIEQKSRCRPVVLEDYKSGKLSSGTTTNSLETKSNIVALVMWHGGFEQGASIQQRMFWVINQTLAKDGYHVLFLDPGGGDDVRGEQENALREAPLLEYAIAQNMAGMIFYPYAYMSNRELIREVSAKMPLILIDRMLPGVETDFVGVSNEQGMRTATEYLIGLGHKRIACVTFQEPINSVQERLAGYRSAIKNASSSKGIYHELILVTDGDSQWAIFDSQFANNSENKPTAIVCMNDYLAFLVYKRLQLHGLRVPEDVSLVGFDNIAQVLPNGVGLTSISQPFEDVGREAARCLLKRIQNPELPTLHLALPTSLVIRESAREIVDDTKIVESIPYNEPKLLDTSTI